MSIAPFDAPYRASPDPWSTADRWYENASASCYWPHCRDVATRPPTRPAAATAISRASCSCVAAWSTRATAAALGIGGLLEYLPAHDEEDLIGACLDAMAFAAGNARLNGSEVRVAVVCDACTDRTARIVRRADSTRSRSMRAASESLARSVPST